MRPDARQKQLPFDGTKEQQRRERVERLLGTTPKLTTGARMFDYAEASKIARGQK